MPKKIIAAGGLVINENDELLMIFRRGKWDLPKGKLDKGESIADCALREVMEETGLQQVKIEKPLGITYHEYFDKRLRNDVIKETYKGNINFRLGGELKLHTIMFRLGGAYYGSPYADDNLKASRLQSIRTLRPCRSVRAAKHCVTDSVRVHARDKREARKGKTTTRDL